MSYDYEIISNLSDWDNLCTAQIFYLYLGGKLNPRKGNAHKKIAPKNMFSLLMRPTTLISPLYNEISEDNFDRYVHFLTLFPCE